MVSNAKSFIKSRKDPLSITNQRVKYVLSYVIECHQLFLKDNVTYSLKEIKNTTKIKPEEYFRSKFVDNYLRRNRSLLQNSQLEDVFFGKEEVELYKDKFGIEQEDKIDIYIRDSGLQKYWSAFDEAYFVIECKRIKQLSDTKDYIIDIEKFCNRNYLNLRLPFEGQIAFIENPKLSHTLIVDEINSRLEKSTTITTDSFLSNTKLHNTLDCSYHSSHKKNYNKKEQFSIYHLMLDYSGIVVD
jgi:hypothetical protein